MNLLELTIKIVLSSHVFTFIASLLTNSMVLLVFIRNKKLRKPVNFFTMTLSIWHLFVTFTHMPILIINAYKKNVPYGDVGCKITGYMMAFTSINTKCILMILSLERYWIIVKPFQFHLITYTVCLKTVIGSCLLCAFWCILPLIGISRYSLEANNLNCALEYNDRNWIVVIYNTITLFIFFGIPLSVILYTNIRIFRIVIF